MALTNGRLAKCDRCGKEHFCKELKPTHLDGGLTEVRKFEDLPDGWETHHSYGVGLLCTDCNATYEKAIRGFKAGYYVEEVE